MNYTFFCLSLKGDLFTVSSPKKELKGNLNYLHCLAVFLKLTIVKDEVLKFFTSICSCPVCSPVPEECSSHFTCPLCWFDSPPAGLYVLLQRNAD